MRERQPEHPHTDIPISLKTWQQLLDGSFKSAFAKEDWEIATEAIDEWVRRHNPDAIPLSAAAGYQWKSLFLPTGTLLRTVFGGKNYHCTVEGDQILHNSKPVSPSGFVNAAGGIRRNSWHCTWILFPDSKDWKLADTLRTRARPHRTRKPAGAAPAPVPAAPGSHPSPAQAVRIAATAFETTNLQKRKDDHAPRTEPTGISLSPPGGTRDAGCRITGDERIAAMLRQELLPLLYRMCACDAMAP